MAELVEYCNCSDVSSFLEAISPARPVIDEYQNWIYRGVSSFETHKLIPKILRHKAPPWNEIGVPSRALNPRDEDRGFPTVEFGIVCRFYRALDESGLPIPGDPAWLRDTLDPLLGGRTLLDIMDEAGAYWPPPGIIELLALAQHYGLSTRFLDWSRSPLHAAYFAVSDVFREGFERCGRLAVWAFHYPPVLSFLGTPDLLRIVKVPSSANPNLHAQRGVFTLVPTKVNPYDKDFDLKPLDEQFAGKLANITIEGSPFRPFRCVTLPRDKGAELAETLIRYGINAGSLFPGFQGAARSVIERNALDLLRHHIT